jgi:hypothetical protein
MLKNQSAFLLTASSSAPIIDTARREVLRKRPVEGGRFRWRHRVGALMLSQGVCMSQLPSSAAPLFAQMPDFQNLSPVQYGALGLEGLMTIGSLVCFILVLIAMFKNGQTQMGIASIVLCFCCGIGMLIAFIMGWVNATRWGIKNVMIFWTALIVINVILNLAFPMPLAPR